MQMSQPGLLFSEILQMRETLVSSLPLVTSLPGGLHKLFSAIEASDAKGDNANSSFLIDLKILIGRQRRRTAAPGTKVECGWRGLFFLQVLQIFSVKIKSKKVII